MRPRTNQSLSRNDENNVVGSMKILCKCRTLAVLRVSTSYPPTERARTARSIARKACQLVCDLEVSNKDDVKVVEIYKADEAQELA